jgi:DNA-nicking Smr family endonuclease
LKAEDKRIFEQEMAGVRPLRAKPLVAPEKSRARPDPGLIYRRDAAQRPLDTDENFLTTGFVEFVHPQEILSFKRGGVQNGVFRKLQAGAYPIEATLDLHLLSLEQARVEVFAFVKDCARYEVRTALVNHGKGGRSEQSQAKMKSYVARWLPLFPEILAFHSAQGFHGGTGAVYILFCKSQQAKERTRERVGLSSGKPVP